MKLFAMMLVGLAASLLFTPAQASITIDSAYLEAAAFDGSVSDYEPFFGTDIPTHTNVDAVYGDAHSRNTLDWSDNGTQSILSFDMDHKRTGTISSPHYPHSYTHGYIFFTANANAPYDLSGYYNVTDVGTGSGHVYQEVRLQDSSDLFYGYQESLFSQDEQFTLGGLGGENYYLEPGSSLTGNLNMGGTYVLSFLSYIEAYPDADSGASADGNITLKIGSASAEVPEPAALVTWSVLGLVGAVVGSQRRRL